MEDTLENPRMKAKEVAEALGMHVSTVWRWSKERPEFPKKRMMGGVAYWIREEVERYAAASGGGKG